MVTNVSIFQGQKSVAKKDSLILNMHEIFVSGYNPYINQGIMKIKSKQ